MQGFRWARTKAMEEPLQHERRCRYQSGESRGAGGRTLKEASAHVMLYLHPEAAKALKRYALDQNVKVHDLLIEAVEVWFRAHGLKEQVRAETVRRQGQTG